MKRRFALLIALLSGVVTVQAQGDWCQIDLSGVTATLTRAQAAAARGEPDQALALLAQADAALADIETGCNPPTVTPEVALGAVYTAVDNSFTVQYPEGWFTLPSSATNSVSLGTDQAAAAAVAGADPNLTSGQRGALVLVGSPAQLTNSITTERSVEGIRRFFQTQLSSVYLVRAPEPSYALGNHLAANLDFSGATFDGLMVVVELEAGRQYAVVAGAAAKGELASFTPTLLSIAASIQAGE